MKIACQRRGFGREVDLVCFIFFYLLVSGKQITLPLEVQVVVNPVTSKLLLRKWFLKTLSSADESTTK